MIISDFTVELSRRLRDVNLRQWGPSVVIAATNSAFVSLCNVVPSAHTVERDMVLAEGTRQKIDADLHRTVDILFNYNEDATIGTPVTVADRGVMDTGVPSWRSHDARAYVKHWLPSSIEEDTFDVWPPASGARRTEPVVPTEPVDPGVGADQATIDQYNTDLAVYNAAVADREAWSLEPTTTTVRGVFTKVPEVVEGTTPVANKLLVTDELPVNIFYLEALYNFALHYCYAVDDDMTANSGRSTRHWLRALQILNKTEETDQTVSEDTVEMSR